MALIELSPEQFKLHLAEAKVSYAYLQTPGGLLQILATEKGVFRTQFVEKEHDLKEYVRNDALNLENFLLVGTPFQINVWRATAKIKAGVPISYEKLAHVIGKPTAFRAVANALGQNKIAYFIPCHRVVRKSGALGGFAWGLGVKEKLLGVEKSA